MPPNLPPPDHVATVMFYQLDEAWAEPGRWFSPWNANRVRDTYFQLSVGWYFIDPSYRLMLDVAWRRLNDTRCRKRDA